MVTRTWQLSEAEQLDSRRALAGEIGTALAKVEEVLAA